MFEELILASSSRRRAEILGAVGWPFTVSPAGVDETRLVGEDALTYVKRLARAKAETVAARFTNRLVLGADTVVVVDSEILGQPHDVEDARRMLRLLSGKWHQVVTGIALVRAGGRSSPMVGHEMTGVHFSEMSAEQIEWYVASGEPRDKAGAYAIQGKAAIFIDEIKGDYFNIVGLPIRKVYELAQALGSDA